MKQLLFTVAVLLTILPHATAQKNTTDSAAQKNKLYLDIHYLPSGKANYNDVMTAHKKDLAVQGLYGVHFLHCWIAERKGVIYCLSSAPNAESVKLTHLKAHGMVPAEILPVTDGIAAAAIKGKKYFLDVHNLGAGKVTAKDVAAAHVKDLVAQKRHGVNFINYWVNEKKGMVVCLSQAADSSAVIATHREAHGLLPDQIMPVKQDQ